MTPSLCIRTIDAITSRYPFCRSELLTRTAYGRPIRTLVIGNGPRKVLYSAAHHANEAQRHGSHTCWAACMLW